DHHSTDKRSPRLTIVGIVVASLAALLILKYASIMLPGSPAARSAALGEVERGPIMDRRGRILAIQTRLDTVTAWRPEIDDIGATARILAEILNLSEDELADRLAAANGFLIVERTITPSQSERIRIERREGRLQGIRLEPDTGRSYPARDAAAAVIGFTGVDNVGLSGVEYMFSGELAPPTGSEDDLSLMMGNQIFLTLDLAIQSEADQIAQDLLSEHDADSVMIIVGEARTGALLALSSQPSFDPNNFRNYSDEERRNRIISQIYEPGSVFKAFSVAGFLELGGIDTEDRFNTSGGYRSQDGGYVITDLADYGWVDAEEIIKFSSNVGAAYASERVDPGAFYTMLTQFGFGRRTGVDLNGEEHGILAPPEEWSTRSRPTLAIGQEIGTTAIQIFAAATTLANGGILLRPQIIDRIVSPSGEVLRRLERDPIREVLSPGTASTMLSLMDRATDANSTGRRIQVEGISVAAETGTAEVFDPETGTYSEEHFIASTLALFPTEDPQLIVYVVIDYPRGESFYGGRIAAPAVDRLIEFLVPYWDIPRDTDIVISHPGRITAHKPQLPPIDGTIPDYTGLPIRVLLPLLGREDVRVLIEGSGWVVRQSPPPGTAFQRGMNIRLELE
ncbi:MAG: transpeptidase family protein, partial [Spirochaetales bacterium]|nr:transpeptidase family protein [Spirochaetales bacterium]